MITVQGLQKTFPARDGSGGTEVLRDLQLTIATDEFVSIVGPSGCGKTTLLKMIAGLIAPDGGSITIDDRPVTGPGHDRAVVFQQFALLPWANVVQNVAFGLELRGVGKAERLAIAHDLIQTVGLRGFERHYPRQLSGGMQQRVGLARALAVNPAILLMDEPFASVDAQTRRTLQEDLLELAHRTRKTIVFVTHDMDEAVRLGDRVMLMSPRPAHIHESLPVALPRPRPDDLDQHPEAIQLKAYLWRQLRAMQPGAPRAERT
jgi:ABC-type nitrate/sulfonate/bicarbonate transport system ATPase subunit